MKTMGMMRRKRSIEINNNYKRTTLASSRVIFTREDAVEAAWAVVDPVLKNPHRTHRYKPGSWGPKQADALIAADGRRHNPISVETTT